MYEMGLRRLFSDALASENNDKIVEKIRGYFNNEDWATIQGRYAWWVLGVIHLMEQEDCASLEVMTEKLQIHTAAGRPVRFGVPDQLNSESPDSWWQEEATKLGLTTEELRRQLALVN